MKIYTDKCLLSCGLIGGTLSRHSGNMREIPNQIPIYKELGLNPQHILHFHQIHSDKIIRISSPQSAQELSQKTVQDADAWLLSPFPAKWGAAIVTADCVPLFLWDETGSHAALAHCGWRGVVQGLPGKVARELLKTAPDLHLSAWLGPHIQACSFEVQEDVAKQFSADALIHKNGKFFVDLNIEIKRQLAQAGMPEKNIKTPYYCTCTDKENFFSWRRDHEKNLLLSFLYKP
ncbi:MAG: polyphenol oxidase family protein [Elusimicrobiaceae bacterium]|nr:polyphenol oxidase family protein [Elusimicrobiaceae bacterium]